MKPSSLNETTRSKSQVQTRRLGLRYALFLSGLLVMSFGIAFTVRSNLGVSPISSVPYLLSLRFPLSFGAFTFIMQVIYVIAQVFIYGKGFPRSLFYQLAVGPVFGLFVDFANIISAPLEPESYVWRLATLILGCFLTAVGIYLQLLPAVIINPGEGIVRALTWRINKPFGSVKMAFDFVLMAIALVMSLLFFGKVISLREGSIVSAFLVGWFTRHLGQAATAIKLPEKLGLKRAEN